ncbi:MAG TPA: hypothetical protein VEC99_14150 [Clostridia bacterium]|nr:hypothetical protein [Clostridia bacterium]
MRWKIYSQTRNWTVALNVADTTISMEPNEQLGWVGRAYALYQLKRKHVTLFLS